MKHATMIRWSLTISLIAVLGLAPVIHADTPDEKPTADQVREDARELMDSLRAYTADQRDEAVEKTARALDRLDARVEALDARLRANWDKMDRAAREQARENLEKLRRHRDQVADHYDALKESSANAWDRVKKGFSDAYRSLHDAWTQSEEDLGAEP
jgi:DNA repair exonuclease SbcCD ATPase subunit